jgi:YVTN family beta-propeller protein
MKTDCQVISRRSVLISAVAAVASCRRKRGDGYNGYAFVANEEGHAIAAVDLTAFAVARHIALDGAPTAVIAHPSKAFVYALTPRSGMLCEIDGNSLTVSRKLHLGGPVSVMKSEPGGEALWILSGPGRRLLRVPVDEFKVTSAFTLPLEPSDFDLSNYTKLAAVSFGNSGTVSLVSLSSGTVGKPLQLSGRLGTIRLRKDGEAVLVANTAARQLSVLTAPKAETSGLRTQAIVHLPLTVRPDYFCFHPDGGQLFITGEGRDAVAVVYPYYVPEVAETVLAGSQPGAMAATDKYLFVTNPGAGDVSILDITRRRVMAVAAVGAGPGSVTVTPDGEYALVLNQTSGDMAVIRIAGLQPDRRKSAALFTMIPVGSKPVSAVVKGI